FLGQLPALLHDTRQLRADGLGPLVEADKILDVGLQGLVPLGRRAEGPHDRTSVLDHDVPGVRDIGVPSLSHKSSVAVATRSVGSAPHREDKDPFPRNRHKTGFLARKSARNLEWPEKDRQSAVSSPLS